MHGYPKLSFWMPRALAKVCFLRIVLEPWKDTRVLVGAAYRKSYYLKMRTTYVQ